MIKNRSKQLIFIVLATFCLCIPGANADNSTVPPSYEASYRRLLAQRDRLLENRAQSVSLLNESDYWLNDTAIHLKVCTSTSGHKQLIAERDGLIAARNEYLKALEYEDEALRDTEKDLAWLEAEMKAFACLR